MVKTLLQRGRAAGFKAVLLLLAAGLGAGAYIGSARADVMSFTLNGGNSALSPYAAPYANVSVDLTGGANSTQATITFTSIVDNGNIYLFGGNGAVGVNVNATSWAISSLTGISPSSSTCTSSCTPPDVPGTGFLYNTVQHTPSLTNGGSGNEDGFGAFNQTFNEFDGLTYALEQISFVVTDNSGTWASASDVLALNRTTDGSYAAAHIFVASLPLNVSNGALITGYAAGNNSNLPPASVPDPQTLLLVATGLLLLGGMASRRKRVRSGADCL